MFLSLLSLLCGCFGFCPVWLVCSLLRYRYGVRLGGDFGIVWFEGTVEIVTGKKSRFFKVFNEAGKRFMTTVSKKNVQKKVTKDHGGFHQQSPQQLDD